MSILVKYFRMIWDMHFSFMVVNCVRAHPETRNTNNCIFFTRDTFRQLSMKYPAVILYQHIFLTCLTNKITVHYTPQIHDNKFIQTA